MQQPAFHEPRFEKPSFDGGAGFAPERGPRLVRRWRLLPGWAQAATHANPIFYMVNAFRYGLLGTSDVPLWVAYGLMLAFVAALSALSLWLLRRGVGLRS